MNGSVLSARTLRNLLPALSLLVLLAAIFYLQPRAISYVGFNLMLNLAIPIAFATIAQMCVITVNDLDLSIGTYVGFVACIGATLLSGGIGALPFIKDLQASGALPATLPWIMNTPLAGVLVLLMGIGVYALLGALIHLRNLPSIVVTLGMSFVWLGLSVLVLPVPGGQAPGWIKSLMTLKTPFIPFPIIAAVVIAVAAHILIMKTSYGAVLRGAGGNPKAIERAGWSLLKVKMAMFALAGFFGMLAGLSLVGLTTSGDANIALRYTLLSIAGVILGGGEFVGGRISPIGAVIGAATLTLAGSFLSFMRIPPDWQIGAQGAILIIVLALRTLIDRAEKRR
ncbi:ABC transporter permease [Kaistia dalseonensis]|uniref:Autoinducer 2 import system permease protein LsrD n=1 Tax=Kaistia dalseonensis TaxID=410840 RepID=A0ABU0H955_9HYPH|nr:ABC transporter permease [Kaistia dalseonensis]MCX5495440.1 ABC transporter permease [Kaistia dalseonensis]MDQ0438029.1 ribose transport system permease protein [Kaistia dalseonensis]